MRKTIIGYSVLMVLGLALAFYASLDRAKDADLSQEWVSIDPADLASISYESPDTKVRIRALPEKNGYWVDFQKEVAASPTGADVLTAGPDGKPAVPGPKKTETDQFKADGNATQLVESFKSLRIEREIGDAGKLTLSDYGLGPEAATLTVTRKQGNPFTLRLGMRSFGSRNVFALDPARNKVILMDGTQIDNLTDARARMFEHNALGFDMNDARKAEIASETYHGKWDQSDRDKMGMPVWKDDEEGATAQASYKTWMDKLAKLRITRYAKDDELAAIQNAPELLSVAFVGDRGPLDQVVLRKTAGGEQGETYWISSKFLTRPAVVLANRVDPVLKDVPNLLKAKK